MVVARLKLNPLQLLLLEDRKKVGETKNQSKTFINEQAFYFLAPELPVIERRNWLLHHHFLRQEWDACKALIKEQLDETRGSCEYASFIKGSHFP